MKITVLGSGGFAYPLVFCNCEYCKEARMLGGRNIRKRASILINDEMIIDLTPDTTVSMSMYEKNMSKVKYLLQTHTHLDHFDTNHFLTLDSKYGTEKEDVLTIIGSSLCLEDMKQRVSMYEKFDMNDNAFMDKCKLKLKTIDHGKSEVVDNYEIKAISCDHHNELGAQVYLIKQSGKTLLYATDTPMISDVALAELKGEKIDCIFLDESFGLKDYMFAHLNLKGFDEYIKKLKKAEVLSENCLVYATHITHDGNPPYEKLQKILEEYGYNSAYDGMELNL